MKWDSKESNKLRVWYIDQSKNREDLEKEFSPHTYKAIEDKARNLGVKRPVISRNNFMSANTVLLKSDTGVKVMTDKSLANLVEVQECHNSLLSALKKNPLEISIPKRWKVQRGRLIESAVLELSDVHCGRTNQFLNLETGQLEKTYDTELCAVEFNQLANNLYEINSLLSSSFQLDDLYIFGVGDLVENNMIFKGQTWFVDYGVGKQLTILLDLMTNFILQMLKMHKTVTFIDVVGNHGRMTERKDAYPIENSFDHLLGVMLQRVFKNEPRVNIIVPDARVYLQKIYTWRYLLQHGENVNSWMGLPYYGIVRQGKSRRIEVQYDLECIGHHHQRMEIPVSSNTSCLVNGSWVEKDQSLWEKFGRISKAEQWYFGVSPKRPRSWSFNVELTKKTNAIPLLIGDKK